MQDDAACPQEKPPRSWGCFEKIDFLDDNINEIPDDSKILGKVCEVENFAAEYSCILWRLVTLKSN